MKKPTAARSRVVHLLHVIVSTFSKAGFELNQCQKQPYWLLADESPFVYSKL